MFRPYNAYHLNLVYKGPNEDVRGERIELQLTPPSRWIFSATEHIWYKSESGEPLPSWQKMLSLLNGLTHLAAVVFFGGKS